MVIISTNTSLEISSYHPDRALQRINVKHRFVRIQSEDSFFCIHLEQSKLDIISHAGIMLLMMLHSLVEYSVLKYLFKYNIMLEVLKRSLLHRTTVTSTGIEHAVSDYRLSKWYRVSASAMKMQGEETLTEVHLLTIYPNAEISKF